MLIAKIGSYNSSKVYDVNLRQGRLRCTCPAAKYQNYCKHVADLNYAIAQMRCNGEFLWTKSSLEFSDEGRDFLKISDNSGW